MVGPRKRLNLQELDELTLATPEARSAFEAARVGRQLRKAREVARLTINEVARRADIDQADLCRIEEGQGVHDVTLAILERLALALGRRIRIHLVEVDGVPCARSEGVR